MSNDTPKTVGQYDVLEKIADGGMGSVFKGRHGPTGGPVAVKLLTRRSASSEVLLRRFEQEFRAASQLDHPHLVRAFDFGVAGDLPYLIMELVEGETLTDLVERKGRLPEGEAIDLINQIAQGLDFAHSRGLVHRDVKPENVLVTPDGIAKLTDLGLIKESEAKMDLTRTGTGLGTPNFMSPEQFRNAKHADRRSDIYALAATMYMLVTAELPFGGCNALVTLTRKMKNELPPVRTLAPELSERLDWAIRRAMNADPEKRPGSCREFIEDLTGRRVRRAEQGVFTIEAVRELWFAIYTENGVERSVKGSLSAVRRLLQSSAVDPHDVRLSVSEKGPFESARAIAEFRDLVIEPVFTPVPQPAQEQKVDPQTPFAELPAPPPPVVVPQPADTGSESVFLTWLAVAGLAAGAFLLGFYCLPG